MRREFGHAKPDPAASRIAPETGFSERERVQNSGDIGDAAIERVGVSIVRLIARPMPAHVDQDQAVLRRERRNVTQLIPVIHAAGDAV